MVQLSIELDTQSSENCFIVVFHSSGILESCWTGLYQTYRIDSFSIGFHVSQKLVGPGVLAVHEKIKDGL